MKTAFCCLVLAAFPFGSRVHAEDSDGDIFAKLKKSGLKLVANTTDLRQSTQPAKLSWSDSRTSGNAVLADIGLKGDFKSLDDLIETPTSFQVGIEYHRNTTKDKNNREKQNSLVAGLTVQTDWNPGEGRLKPILKESIT